MLHGFNDLTICADLIGDCVLCIPTVSHEVERSGTAVAAHSSVVTVRCSRNGERLWLGLVTREAVVSDNDFLCQVWSRSHSCFYWLSHSTTQQYKSAWDNSFYFRDTVSLSRWAFRVVLSFELCMASDACTTLTLTMPHGSHVLRQRFTFCPCMQAKPPASFVSKTARITALRGGLFLVCNHNARNESK